MSPEDWLNVAKCADQRVMSATFSFDSEENNILGDLQTREMALSQAYRETLIASTYMDISRDLAREFNREGLFEEIADQKIRKIEIHLLTD